MKKNYLLVALMGALVLSGCNGNSTSSSSATVPSSSSTISNSSSSSSAKALPTINDAVAKLGFNYTVEYTKANNESYSVYVENTDQNEVILFFESTNDGYFFDAVDNAFYFYMSGSNQPTYNTVGQLKSEEAEAMKSIIDIKSAFEGASWDLVTEGKEIVYFTEDIEVMAAAAFLTEDLENVPASVEVSIKATSSSAKLVGFKTCDADGDVLATADFKRLGTTYATETLPLLNDDIDTSLEGMWYIATTDNETVLGSANSYFEIFIYDDASYLVEYALNPTTYQLTPADVFTYVEPSGHGSYKFENEATDEVEVIAANGTLVDKEGDRMYNTGCFFATRDHSTNAVATGIAVSYFELSFVAAVDAYNEYNKTNPNVTTTYEIQIFQPEEEGYASFVTDLGAIGAYYIAELDADGNEVEAGIYTQWATIDDLIYALNGLFQGGFDSTLYNGCALGFYLYSTFFLTAYATEAAVDILYNISKFLDPVYAEVDTAKYATPEAGQSCKDYIVSAMEGMDYTSNSDSFVSGNTDYIALIKEVNTDVEAGITCTDVIFFEGADGSYGCILVVDDNGEVFVTTIGFGHFAVIGVIYELLVCWSYAQQVPQV